ncbi:MAG: glycosyltransferase family 2 protein [Candidatus Ranarchaeia archaeon]
MSNKNVCAIIPCYNESKFIENVILETKKHVDCVIVVNDGSEDETGIIAEKTEAIIVNHEKNIGKGEALRTGFAKAIEIGCHYVVTLDGDQQHPPDLILDLVNRIKEGDADIVIGSRFLNPSKNMPWLRVLTNKTTSGILRKIFGVPITDSQSGFRIFKKEVIENVKTVEERFVMETEILIEAHRKGYVIKEIQIPTIYGLEESKQSPAREFYQWGRLAIRKIFHRKPL